MALTLLTGPVASGKSRIAAESAARWQGHVDVVVTAEGLDEEMRARIDRHRAERPDGWRVHEEPIDLAGAMELVPPDAFAIVDCLTLWASNLLGAGEPPDTIVRLAHDAAGIAASRSAPTVVVTNEVGWGIVPVNDLARSYRDLLGRVNAAFAARADRAWLVVAGRVMSLTPVDHTEMLA